MSPARIGASFHRDAATDATPSEATALLVAAGGLAGGAWALARLVGTGILSEMLGSVLALAVLLPLARSRTMHRLVERWAEQERTARDEYLMHRDSADDAARLRRDRWPDASA